jgi:HEAT repeat protein
LASNNTRERSTAVHVLGLLQKDPQAAELTEKALEDQKTEVRVAAATALGQMGSKTSIPKLTNALNDKESAVVLAAAHALLTLGDETAYEIYYAILTGERKSGAGLMDEQEKMLKDPKKMAQFGFEEGIGLIPFAGLGWDALKALTRDDVSPVRAAAAKVLAGDPDPHSSQALAKAVSDKSWVVRVAALDAIAKRGDPALLGAVTPALSDEKDAVRYTAAAAVLRLTALAGNGPGHREK